MALAQKTNPHRQKKSYRRKVVVFVSSFGPHGGKANQILSSVEPCGIQVAGFVSSFLPSRGKVIDLFSSSGPHGGKVAEFFSTFEARFMLWNIR